MDLARAIDDRSPRGIAAAIAHLVSAGDLRAGDRLPSVRELGAALGVSPATVSGAYRALRAVGVVGSRGRAGTTVSFPVQHALTPGYRALSASTTARDVRDGVALAARTTTPVRFDLSRGTPDAGLLPSLGEVLAAVAHEHHRAAAPAYAEATVVPGLERVLRETWPVAVERLTVVDGALDAVVRTLEQVVAFGDRVAVEEPGFPPLFDALDRLGAIRVPLAMDRHGVTPASLASALEAGAAVVLLQPRAQNPTGASLTATRARELAALVRRHSQSDVARGQGKVRAASVRPGRRLLVIEDDHSGLVAHARDVTLAAWIPDRVVHVRSYSKSHGPELRIAAVGGPAREIDALVARRMVGPGWTSRILQTTLARLLTDPRAVAQVERARRTYRARMLGLVTALSDLGVEAHPGDGLNLWLPVADERVALERLAAAGVRAVGGSAFHREMVPRTAHLRLTVAGVTDPAATAEVLAVAAG
ncbi:PLP-dependent aminotransferase family protein [Litorihabitans aurantiacus]|uniref:GntR family transcriptional regulator n=1 Tax=Litorihabitans aurantiacus TaxID=1930061 RepID=A0AA37XEV8_9MICO|nr:aminotransferase class I/II-fold pyridoxal phosphate-dependent enzyme [Litorihabitans aurantiacus]GMA31864.1 GntR family transcriptional regulator [Litorihabitans aurantiacus]